MDVERSILKCVRRCSLWAFLVAAIVALLLSILETWNALETQEYHYFDGMQPTAWGRIQNTAAIITMITLVILLAILIADKAKLGKDKVSKAWMPPTTVAKPVSSTASTSAVKSTTKAAAPAPGKSAPKKPTAKK